MESLTIGQTGEITLPDEVRRRYHLTPSTALRIVETRSGILLVPLVNEPMDPELEQELQEWQALSVATWEMFPYEDGDE